MNITEVLNTVYYRINSTATQEDIYDLIFHELQKQSSADINTCKNIMFIEEGELRYRKVFKVNNNNVTNQYGFNKHVCDVVAVDEDGAKLKEIFKEFVTHYENKTETKTETETKEEPKMNNTLEKMIEMNKDSAVRSAKVEMGKSANRLVLKKVKPNLPMMMRGYAESPLAEAVIGNIVAGLLVQFAGNNKKAIVLSEAMVAAGAQVAIESFDIPNLINELLNNVDMSGLATDEEE